MATIEQLTSETLRRSTQGYLAAKLSPLLLKYLEKRDVYSMVEFAANPVVNLIPYKMELTTDTVISGIEILAPFIETLIIPALKGPNDTPPGPFSSFKINVSDFKNIKVLTQQGGKASKWDGLNYQIVQGSLEGVTTLTELALGIVVPNSFKLCNLSENKQLKTVNLQGPALASAINSTTIGNLQTNLALEYVGLTYLGASNATLKAAMDNMFSSLRTQKMNGGLISTIDCSESPAPTGGATNPDVIWLKANGTTVIEGNK